MYAQSNVENSRGASQEFADPENPMAAAVRNTGLEIPTTTVNIDQGTGRKPPDHMEDKNVRGTFQQIDPEIAVGTTSERHPARASTPFIGTRSHTQTQGQIASLQPDISYTDISSSTEQTKSPSKFTIDIFDISKYQ